MLLNYCQKFYLLKNRAYYKNCLIIQKPRDEFFLLKIFTSVNRKYLTSFLKMIYSKKYPNLPKHEPRMS